ncbi:DNA translocase FtsK [Listeria grayi]|uniref:DNA translocase FtsK n=2 Tax=Listeria grayi TaxID=1641 RepID=UPI001626EC1F|nr:DNA translocase FtsK [Listeria grayi]MBC1920816.1 DNA translocase FtsK [Listeria grayi]
MGWFKEFFFGDLEETPEEKAEKKQIKNEQEQPIQASKQVSKQQNQPPAAPKKAAFNQQSIRQEAQPIIRRNPVPKPKKNRAVSAKMTYQYPKGEFRFPLIPDGVQQQEASSAPVYRQTEPVHKVKEAEAPSESVSKKPFAATDVPSPVFAFQKRPSKFEFGLSDTKVETVQEEIAEDIQINPVDTELQAETASVSFDAHLDAQIQTEAEVQEVTHQPEPELTQSAMISESVVEPTEMVEPIIEEPAVLEEQPLESEPEAPSEAAEATIEPEKEESLEQQEEKVETQAQHSAAREQKSKKTHIPFNVMMINRDKTKLEKKPEPASPEPAIQTEVVTSEAMSGYYFPSEELLNPPVFSAKDEAWLDDEQLLLDETFENFNVQAKVVDRTQGPAVTRFEVQPEKGVKVSKITNLSDDIKLNLAAKDIRIEAPIPGKSTVGIEIPNPQSRPVMLSEIMGTPYFQNAASPLTAALGLDISGEPILTDLQKMPHGLIAGATGSGKSVCINSLLVSLLYKATPDQLKLLLIDPKMVELAPYNHIPHLVSPVITDAKAATAALKWAVEEMERRYQLFSHTGVRNMEKYNEYASHPDHTGEKLPYILIVIDELADLMMVAPSDVEEAISRIAQKARACGIHMIVATQRPSVDVITGLIKANIPTRISFSVSSQIDSRTILDVGGAEKLLGRGDMLFLANGTNKPVRLQGTFVSDEEIDAVVAHVRNQGEPNYLFEQEELLAKAVDKENTDELFDDACEFVLSQNAASTSLLQRHFRIGYNRAARLMEALEAQQIVSGTNGTKPRDVIITRDQLAKLREIEQ